MNQTMPNRALAIVACLLMGMFGIHNFYIGKNGTGAAQLCLTLASLLLFPLGLLIAAVWNLVDLLSLAFKSESAWRSDYGPRQVAVYGSQQSSSFLCQRCGNVIEMPSAIFDRMIGEYTECPYCQQDVEVRHTRQRGY